MCAWLNEFYGFSLFSAALYDTLLMQHVVTNKTKVMQYYLQKNYLKDGVLASVKKVSGQMHSNTYI